MLRVLFVYRYCTMGGVETGLRFRLESLPRQGVDAHALFLRDYGGRPAFEHLADRVGFGDNASTFAERVRSGRYDLISVIDSFDVLDWITEMHFEGKVLVELRSTYEHTLVHLKRLGHYNLHGLLVPSRFQANHVARFLPTRVLKNVPCHVVYNYIDLETFRHRPTSTDHYGKRIVCWVGRIDPLKNWPEFLAIAGALAHRHDVEFWMVGGGRSPAEAREKFRKAIRNNSVAGKLRWWPLVPTPHMPQVYSAVADSGGLVLLTTKCESFGFAALETMACRCPLVAPAVGALPEIVEDGVTGLLYPSGDIQRAADLVSGLLDDAGHRHALAKRAVRSVHERFSPDTCASRFAEVIRSIVEGVEPALT